MIYNNLNATEETRLLLPHFAHSWYDWCELFFVFALKNSTRFFSQFSYPVYTWHENAFLLIRLQWRHYILYQAISRYKHLLTRFNFIVAPGNQIPALTLHHCCASRLFKISLTYRIVSSVITKDVQKDKPYIFNKMSSVLNSLGSKNKSPLQWLTLDRASCPLLLIRLPWIQNELSNIMGTLCPQKLFNPITWTFNEELFLDKHTTPTCRVTCSSISLLSAWVWGKKKKINNQRKLLPEASLHVEASVGKILKHQMVLMGQPYHSLGIMSCLVTGQY